MDYLIFQIEGYQLDKIEFVKNLTQLHMFHSTIEKIEIREKFSDFQPNLTIESNTQERIRILEQGEIL